MFGDGGFAVVMGCGGGGSMFWFGGVSYGWYWGYCVCVFLINF